MPTAPVADTGTTVDLDKLRARRREADRKPAGTVTVGGDTYELPAELPLGVLDVLGRLNAGEVDALGEGVRLLFPDELDAAGAVTRSPAHELLYRHGLTVEDFGELIGGLSDRYGIPGGLPN